MQIQKLLPPAMALVGASLALPAPTTVALESGSSARADAVDQSESARVRYEKLCRAKNAGPLLEGAAHFRDLREIWWKIDLRGMNHLEDEDDRAWGKRMKRRYLLAKAHLIGNNNPGVCRAFYDELKADLEEAKRRWPCPKSKQTRRGCR